MNAISFLKQHIEDYDNWRRLSGRKNKSYMCGIIAFDHYCARTYPDATCLTQEMVDKWLEKRDTETTNSCVSRVYPAISFIRYLNSHQIANLSLTNIPKKTRQTYVPHAFSTEELVRFFEACDGIKPRKGMLNTIQRLVIPVLFRLLYSSGLRTTEAVLLETKNVNLQNGVISICAGKGYNEHIIVMHDTMLELMMAYDRKIASLIPGRRYFFPNQFDEPYSSQWVTRHFSILWKKSNKTKAIPYELRHNYAIENIDSWRNVGFGIHDKLLALSKSMGHRDLKNTMGYYSSHQPPQISWILLMATFMILF